MKTSRRRVSTVKRFWSILLCLAMMLMIFPSTVLATDYREVTRPDKDTVEAVNIYRQSILLEMTVEQDGTQAPPAETFEFELIDTAEVPDELYHYGITLQQKPLVIETDGEGKFTKTIDIVISPSSFEKCEWDVSKETGGDKVESYSKTFLLRQKNTGKTGWSYSTKEYELTFRYIVETNEMTLRIHEPWNDGDYDKASFTNTFVSRVSTCELPFTKTVKLGGNAVPGPQAFELEIFDVGVSWMTDVDHLYTATVNTDGAGSYDGTLLISGPPEEVADLTCEGFYVREKDTGARNWTYSDAIWHVVPVYGENGPDFEFYSATFEYSEYGHDYYVDAEIPADKMTFENIYTDNYTHTDYEIPFTKMVQLDGNADPGRQAFELEIFNVGVSSMTDVDHLYTATVNTDGAGKYDGTLTISGPSKEVEDLTCEGFYVREKDTGARNWTYSDAVWHVVPVGGENGRTFEFYPATFERSEYGHDYYVDAETPAEVMVFENIYTGDSAISYEVAVKETKNGKVTVSPNNATQGDTVTLTVTPQEGYLLATLTVVDSEGKEIRLTEKDGKYIFTMPDSEVTVNATFRAETGGHSFVDVARGSYYEEAVMWAVDNGVTSGTSDTTFSPDGICTRAQAVTFLWRAAGSPAPRATNMPFADVKAGSYYYNAVLWAVENGITAGTSDTAFSPDLNCSRAQIVSFLYRTAGSPAVSGSAAFTDVAADAYYAKAVKWAEAQNITSGIGGGLFGSDNNCTRAQIVTFIWRYMVK